MRSPSPSIDGDTVAVRLLGQTTLPKERGFYLQFAVYEKWSKRELERQIKSALFEPAVLAPAKVSPSVRQEYPEALSVFKDAYMLEFLDLPPAHAEGLY